MSDSEEILQKIPLQRQKELFIENNETQDL